MKCTGSISKGHTANLHNSRVIYKDADHTPAHIDPDRVKEDVFLVNLQLEEVYERAFGDALRDYNERQVTKRHPERQIVDYLKKVKDDKQLKPMYEFVIQVGNKDERPEKDVACEIYREWLSDFQERYGANFSIAQAIIHNDEATPHLHLEIVPTAHSKRGLAVQNSLTKAIKQAGHGDYKDMLEAWDSLLTARMEAHGLERVAGEKERQMGGVDINTYKRTMAALSETRSEVEKAREEVAEKSAERDAISVQIDQMEARLECVQGDLAAVESIEAAGLIELGKLAAGAGDGERESAAQAENRELRARLAAIESEGGELEGRVRKLERERDELGGRVQGLRDRLEGLRDRLASAWEGLETIAERVKTHAFAQVGRLKWVFDELGLTAYEGDCPLVARDYIGASEEPGRSWEPPAPSLGHGR